MAAVDFFLKIDGIDGESTDAKHKGEIAIESWSWGESNSNPSTGGGGAGRTVKQDFHFVAHTAKQSPPLFLACATGQHIKTGTLTCRKAGGEQSEFLKIRLADVLVSSYQIGGSDVNGDGIPRDQFSLNFHKLEMQVLSVNADGKVGATTFGGFDFQNNKVIPPPLPGS